MTDARAKRIAVLTAAAQAKSEAKTRAAEQAIRALVKRGEPITFQAVQREAGVSHAFLYGHPDLRGRIEHLRARTRPTGHRPRQPDTDSTLVLALTAQITELKKRHRQEVARPAERARKGPRREPRPTTRTRPTREWRRAPRDPRCFDRNNDVTSKNAATSRPNRR